MAYRTVIQQHKTLFYIGAALLILGAVYRFYPDLAQLFPQSSEIEVKLNRLAKYRQKVQTRQTLQAQQAVLTRQLDQAERVLLSAATPALAAVEIQNIINDIIFTDQMEMASMRVLKAEDATVAGYLAVPVQVTLKLSIGQLLDLLHRLESANRLLSITALVMSRPPTGEADKLNATMTVEGYMLKG